MKIRTVIVGTQEFDYIVVKFKGKQYKVRYTDAPDMASELGGFAGVDFHEDKFANTFYVRAATKNQDWRDSEAVMFFDGSYGDPILLGDTHPIYHNAYLTCKWL